MWAWIRCLGAGAVCLKVTVENVDSRKTHTTYARIWCVERLLRMVVKRGVVGETEGTCAASIFSIGFDLAMERRFENSGGNVDALRGLIGKVIDIIGNYPK
jgi:hypothetical protein